LWRRRRLFGNRAQRELFSFYLELEEAAVEGLSLDSVQDLRCETCYVFLEGEDPRLEETMERLDKRLVRVTEAYLTELAEELVRLEVWGQHWYRADLLDQPPEVIGNGLVRRREVRRRMNKHRPKGKPRRQSQKPALNNPRLLNPKSKIQNPKLTSPESRTPLLTACSGRWSA
jgi:hypothetical protein